MVPLVRLLRRPPEAPVTAAMRRDARAVLPTAPFSEVVERFEKYHLRALAVVDEFGFLVGLITIEDVLSRLAQRADRCPSEMPSARSSGRLAWLFAIIGPGVITSNVDNDAGGIYTYSLCGARYGYSLLWILLPVTVALVVVQEMCARMGTVTGKGLADLIREHFGLRVTFLVMMAVLFTNFGNAVAEFAGLASSLELFGISRYVSVPLGAAFVWWLVVFGSYKSVEKAFLIACLLYLAYPFSGLPRPPRLGGRGSKGRCARPCRSTSPASRWWSASSAPPSRRGCSSTCSPRWSRRRSRSPTTASRGSTWSSARSWPWSSPSSS